MTKHTRDWTLAGLLALALLGTATLAWASLLFAGSQHSLPPPLQPQSGWIGAGLVALWAAVLFAYVAPRRRQGRPFALVAIAALAVIAIVLSISSVARCTDAQDSVLTPVWRTMVLFTGTTSEEFFTTGPCRGGTPIAAQVARFAAVAAVFGSVLAFALTFAARQWERIKARFVPHREVIISVNDTSMPLIQVLIDRKDAQVRGHQPEASLRTAILALPGEEPAAQTARDWGATVYPIRIGAHQEGSPRSSLDAPDPQTVRALLPFLTTRGRVSVERVWIMHEELSSALAIKDAVTTALVGAQPSVVSLRRPRRGKRQQTRAVRIVVLARQRRQARALRREWMSRIPAIPEGSGSRTEVVLDPLCPTDVTAAEVIGRISTHMARETHDYHIVLCSDTALAEAVIVEAATRAWEESKLQNEESRHPQTGEATSFRNSCDPRDILVCGRMPTGLILVAPSADETRAAAEALVVPALKHQLHLTAINADWPTLQRSQLPPGRLVLVLTTPVTPERSHLPDRLRLRLGDDFAGTWAVTSRADRHPHIRVEDWEHTFANNVLLDGHLPEDSWARLARFQHESYRRRFFEPANPHRYPWWHSDLDKRLPHEKAVQNLTQVRVFLKTVARLGYVWGGSEGAPEWKPTSDLLLKLAKIELARWEKENPDDPTHAGATRQFPAESLWERVSEEDREKTLAGIRANVEAIQAYGFIPRPRRRFQRVGRVNASRLHEPLEWTTNTGAVLQGEPGDWIVASPEGGTRTVKDIHFRASFRQLQADEYERVGVYAAHQVDITTRVETLEGPALARPGDWIVEAPDGSRWPVRNIEFQATYSPLGVDGDGDQGLGVQSQSQSQRQPPTPPPE